MNADELDWDDLRYFLRAVRAGTLAGAARALGVEHTTVGRRLSALERVLGAPLVLRRPDGLVLTTLGRKLVPLIESIDRSVQAIRDLAEGQQIRVRLAVPSGFTKLFADAFGELREAHPEICLELVSGAKPVDLEKGEADLAIRIGPITDENLIQRKLGTAGSSLYASESYLSRRPAPADIDDLTGHEIIAYDVSLGSLPAAQWIEERARNATIALRSREMTEMIAAATSGLGLAVLSCVLADAEPTLRRLTSRVVATREVSLVYRREARTAEPVRSVIDFVIEVIGRHADRLSGKLGSSTATGSP